MSRDAVLPTRATPWYVDSRQNGERVRSMECESRCDRDHCLLPAAWRDHGASSLGIAGGQSERQHNAA